MKREMIYVFVAFAVIYAVRVLPLTLIRRPIRSQFLRSFLYYVPYVTLAVMTFPAIVEATAVPAAGIAVALWKGNLVAVSGVCCAVVFAVEWLLR